jgi:hypothetical protein
MPVPEAAVGVDFSIEALSGRAGDTAESPLRVAIHADPGLSVMALREPATTGSAARGPLLTTLLP